MSRTSENNNSERPVRKEQGAIQYKETNVFEVSQTQDRIVPVASCLETSSDTRSL
jgi:hypothetical protein